MTRIFSVLFVLFVSGCSLGLPNNNGGYSSALPAATEGHLAESVMAMMEEHPGLTGVVPLMHGADAFVARMLLADVATTSIDTQYYIWRSDLTGHLLLDRLQRAAERGVKVRLLLDDHGTGGLDPEIIALQSHPNVEVRLWNPFVIRRFKPLAFAYDFFRLNRRMHNKSFTVDGQASILGGRNVGDEYFGTGKTALFVDLDVLVAGEVLPAISADFDAYWNSPSAFPAEQIITKRMQGKDPIKDKLESYNNSAQMSEYRELLNNSSLISDLTEGELVLEWTNATLISDSPAKGQGAVARKDLLYGHMQEAVGEIKVKFDGVSAYFVPGAAGVKAFTELEERGVQVRMLTNALEATDVLPVHAGYAKRRKKLLKSGVELYELRRQVAADAVSNKLGPFGSSGASLHAKTFAVDGERIFVGSFNFDPRSARLNTEMGLLIESPWMAQGLHAAFDAGLGGTAWKVELHDGRMVWIEPEATDKPPLTKEPGRTFWRNIGLMVIGWLPIEWLL